MGHQYDALLEEAIEDDQEEADPTALAVANESIRMSNAKDNENLLAATEVSDDDDDDNDEEVKPLGILMSDDEQL